MTHAGAQADQLSGVTRLAGGIVVRVSVQAGAGRTESAGLQGPELLVRIAQRAVHEAANTDLVAYIAEVLSVAKREVEIISGRKSRSKRARIYTRDPITLEFRLGNLALVSTAQGQDTFDERGGG